MPIELRRVILSESETIDAARSFLRANPEIMGAVAVKSVAVQKDGGTKLVCNSDSGAWQGEQILTLDRAQVLRMLVRFCLENNIPLPRNARKAPALHGRSLALQIDMPGDENLVD